MDVPNDGPKSVPPAGPGELIRKTSSSWSMLSFKTAKSSLDTYQDEHVTVDMIKPHVLIEFSNHPNMYHEKDVEMVKENDSYIQSMINVYPSTGRKGKEWFHVYDFIIKELKWRNEFGLNDLNDGMFPQEFHDLKLHNYGMSSDGCLIIYVSGQRYPVMTGLQTDFTNFACHYFEKLLQKFGRNVKCSLLLDASNCGLKNCDIQHLFSIVPLVLNHYAHVADMAYVLNVPWILKPFAKSLLLLAPSHLKNKLKFVSNGELHQIVPTNCIPTIFGGSLQLEPLDSLSNHDMPKITFEQLHEQLDLSRKVMIRNRNIIRDLLKE